MEQLHLFAGKAGTALLIHYVMRQYCYKKIDFA